MMREAHFLVIFLLLSTTPSASADGHAPTKVTLSASGITADCAKLTWTQSDDWLFDHYEVWMEHDGQEAIVTNIDSKIATSYTVRNLEPGKVTHFG